MFEVVLWQNVKKLCERSVRIRENIIRNKQLSLFYSVIHAINLLQPPSVTAPRSSGSDQTAGLSPPFLWCSPGTSEDY